MHAARAREPRSDLELKSIKAEKDRVRKVRQRVRQLPTL